MRCEVVSIGTELLLGHLTDTNAPYICQRLALAGIDVRYRTTVGDNEDRIADVVRGALERSEAVITCGGLGPTPDDITREAIAAVMGVSLRRDVEMADQIRRMFEQRGRPMAANNARQADLPDGATFIVQTRGTAPGLICPVADRVVYALPGPPDEMEEMLDRGVMPDLRRRVGAEGAVIRSRILGTWGLPESTLAEMVSSRVDGQTNPTIAFLARGIEGIQIRITAKADSGPKADAMLAHEEKELRALVGDALFGVDQSMEEVVATLLEERDWTVGVAESLTGGLVGARLAETEGASKWFRGSIVAYDSEVKYNVLGVPRGPVVCEEAARAMALGARRVLDADVGLGITGVAGPATQEDQPVGTVFMSVALGDNVHAAEIHLPGDRRRVRQLATISLLDMLRRRILAG